MSNLRTSFIRTVVPMVVGALISIAAHFHLVLPTESLTELVTALAGATYYAAVRFLEVKVSPKWGWLLVSKAKPVYTQPSA